MSKHKTRHNKACLNCNSFVERDYCPRCGQQNTESRHSFHYLFTHFISDFLHYDNSFWRTARSLFFSPGKLSLEYMKGKRKSYANPFSLYIFVSFITFFLPSVLPKYTQPEGMKVRTNIGSMMIEKDSTDNKTKKIVKDKILEDEADEIMIDIMEDFTKGDVNKDAAIYKAGKKVLTQLGEDDRNRKFIEFFINNLSKVLFIYMPIFAFTLWLAHNKKKHFYFDSGVFTLHFFSVLLLSITFCIILSNIASWLRMDGLTGIFWVLLVIYITFYFFRGNRVFYGESRFVSNIKAFFLMGINTFVIIVVMIMYVIFAAHKAYGLFS